MEQRDEGEGREGEEEDGDDKLEGRRRRHTYGRTCHDACLRTHAVVNSLHSRTCATVPSDAPTYRPMCAMHRSMRVSATRSVGNTARAARAKARVTTARYVSILNPPCFSFLFHTLFFLSSCSPPRASRAAAVHRAPSRRANGLAGGTSARQVQRRRCRRGRQTDRLTD